MIENRVRLSLPRHLKCWDYGAHNLKTMREFSLFCLVLTKIEKMEDFFNGIFEDLFQD